jgi:hypothetical protein
MIAGQARNDNYARHSGFRAGIPKKSKMIAGQARNDNYARHSGL